ncbi:MAG TPA: DUF2849 domain-containing protein [Beijerinckia sp.]|nr:DUF2849 domain-containing protein [Beijerinckia sp.]
MLKVVSANRLTDGIVVYLRPDGTWADQLNQANCFESEALAEAGLEAARNDAKKNLILDPFLVEVTANPEGLHAVSLRNAIRAKGPTVDFAPRS